MALKHKQYLAKVVTREMVMYLMEDYNIPLKKALDLVYSSKTFKDIYKFETGLYRESSAYNFEILKDELKGSGIIKELEEKEAELT